MERQLFDLQTEREYDTDQVLCKLICAQRISEMISQLQQADQSADMRPCLDTWVVNLDKLLVDFTKQRGNENLNETHHCK